MIYIKTCVDIYENQIIYALSSLLRNIGFLYKIYDNEELNEKDILISYGETSFEKSNYNQIFIKNYNKLFGENYKNEESIPNNIYEVDNLITMFSDNINSTYDINGNCIVINIDIIADTFFLLSRYEEYIIGNNIENHNRFSIENSILYKKRLLEKPLVNEYSLFLKNLILKLNPNVEIVDDFFNKSKFFISHDIDSISKYNDKFLRKLVISIIRERNIKKAIKLVIGNLKYIIKSKSDTYWSFYYLLNLEKKYGFKATYYFMGGGETSRDNNYSIKNRRLKNVFKDLKEFGNEIGIHGSYNSYNNEKLLKYEIDQLENESNIKVLGIRQHFLRFNIRETWKLQKKLNLKYDSTVGYAEHIGFRCGTCTPFKVFNLDEEKELNYWEIPLIVMDTTLNNKSYMGLNANEAIKRCEDLYDTIETYNGVFAFLWHNSSLDVDGGWDSWKTVYESIVKYAYEKKAIGISGIDIINIIDKHY